MAQQSIQKHDIGIQNEKICISFIALNAKDFPIASNAKRISIKLDFGQTYFENGCISTFQKQIV